MFNIYQKACHLGLRLLHCSTVHGIQAIHQVRGRKHVKAVYPRDMDLERERYERINQLFVPAGWVSPLIINIYAHK
jgi:hypothetical protein